MGQFLSRVLDAYFGGQFKKNPALEAQGPGDVDYTYKGDPEQAIKKYGTKEPYIRPTFFQSVLSPTGAAQVNAINRQYQMTPIQAQQELAIAQQQLPARISMSNLANTAAAELNNQLQNRLAPDAIARRVKENRALGESAFEFEKQVFPEKLDMQLKEQLASAKQAQAVREAYAGINTELEAERASKIQQEHGKIQSQLKAAADKAELERHTSDIAELRQAGALPPELAKYSDEVLAKMLKGNLDSANLANEAQARASISAGLPTLGAQERVAELGYRIPRAQGLGIEATNRLGALQENPEIVREIANNELLGQRFAASTGGMSPAQATQADRIPRLSPDGVLFEKSPIPSEWEESMPALLPSGQTATSPDGTPLPRVTPSRPFTRPVSQRNLAPAPQPAAQTLAPETPVTQTGDWLATSQEIEQALSNVHPSTRVRVWDVVLEELAKEIRLPKQQIGSSRFTWDNKTVLKRMLEDPSTAQAVIAQFSEIPAERMEAIKQKAFKFASY